MRLTTLIFTFMLSSLSYASDQSSNRLNAEESDPVKMNWMVGFPPPADKLIMQPESDFFSFPKLRWTACHIRELMPTKQVSRGIGSPEPFTYAKDKNINTIKFMPMYSEREMTWAESLSENYTDGILILHKGQIVYEEYFGCLSETGKHAAMSMTKSLTGLLAEILIAEGRLKENAKVSSIIPELKNSAFGSATVRQVMDMTTALDYSEDYSDPNADIWLYSKAASLYRSLKITMARTVIWSTFKQLRKAGNTERHLGTRPLIRMHWAGLLPELRVKTLHNFCRNVSGAR